MLFVKLNTKRKIRGQDHQVGAIVEVSSSLRDRLILAGVATKSNEQEYEVYKTALTNYKKLNKDDLTGYAKSLMIEVPGDAKKEDIYLLIEEKLQGENS